MVAVYASTSPTWFNALRRLSLPSVAFWRPTPSRPKAIQPGEPWLFKEWGAPRLLGFGRFARYEVTTPEKLFGDFGKATGADSLSALLNELRAAKDSITASTAIGNVVLTDFAAFDQPIDINLVNLPNLSVPFAYVPETSTALSLVKSKTVSITREALALNDYIAKAPPERREYLREFTLRDRAHVRDLKMLYKGHCQVSGAVVLGGIAGDLTEAHHIHWLTRGGIDDPSNMVVISPQVHAAIHAVDASFNWQTLTFNIGGQEFPLALNRHLKPR